MLPPHLASAAEACALSGLNALVTAARRASPDTVLIVDDEGPVTAGALDRRIRVLAYRFGLSGLRRGERLIIVACPQVQTMVAIIAALRAGLEPALVRPGCGAVELAAHANVAEAAALIGPAVFGDTLGETYLSAAAIAQGVRLIATHGAAAVDGAVDVSAAALDGWPEPSGTGSGEMPLEMPLISTFVGPAEAPRLVSHRQAALFADALSLVEQARINPSRSLVSLLPPASRAGLVAGPFAALVGASKLALHGPFDAAVFLRLIDAEPGAHLVAPVGIGPLLANEVFAANLSSLILVSRFERTDDFALPAHLPAVTTIADVYAFGENSILAQRRLDGEARPPNRAADRSLADGLGARLNRARAEQRLHSGDGG